MQVITLAVLEDGPSQQIDNPTNSNIILKAASPKRADLLFSLRPPRLPQNNPSVQVIHGSAQMQAHPPCAHCRCTQPFSLGPNSPSLSSYGRFPDGSAATSAGRL